MKRIFILFVTLSGTVSLGLAEPPSEEGIKEKEQRLREFLASEAGFRDVVVGIDEKTVVVAFRPGGADRDSLISQISASLMAAAAAAPWVQEVEVFFHVGGAPIGSVKMPASVIRSTGEGTTPIGEFIRQMQGRLLPLALGDPGDWLASACEVESGWTATPLEGDNGQDVLTAFRMEELEDSHAEDYPGALVSVDTKGETLIVGVFRMGSEKESNDFAESLPAGAASGKFTVHDLVYLVHGPEQAVRSLKDALANPPIHELDLMPPGDGESSFGESTNATGTMSAEGDSRALVDLVSEYGGALPAGVVNEATEMAREVYGIDYRATVAKAAVGDKNELSNLFAMTMDGAAAEIHAEVLFRLQKGLGATAFDAILAQEAGISQKRVRDLIACYRENLSAGGAMPAAQPSASPSEAGRMEGLAASVAGEERPAKDPMNPENEQKVTSVFPVFLADGMYEHYRTPAQVAYFYVVDSLFRGGRVSQVGSPEISEAKVSIDFVMDGEKRTLWFVERSREGDQAEVVVGPPNVGGDLFRLRRIDGRWAIAGIEKSDGI